MTLAVNHFIRHTLQAGGADHRIPLIVVLGSTPQRVFQEVFGCLEPHELERVVAFVTQLPQGEPPSKLRVSVVATDELVQAEGCLCCSIRSELASSLSQLFLRVLRRQEPGIGVVVVVTEASQADTLVQTLKHAPFLGQRYKLQACLPLIDG